MFLYYNLAAMHGESAPFLCPRPPSETRRQRGPIPRVAKAGFFAALFGACGLSGLAATPAYATNARPGTAQAALPPGPPGAIAPAYADGSPPVHRASSPSAPVIPAALHRQPAADPIAFLAVRSVSPTDHYSHLLTDDWFGLRPRLKNAGITFGGSLIQDGSWNFLGGVSTQKFVYRSRLDLNMTLHLGKLVGLHGGAIYADMMSIWGQDANNNLVGTLQGFDTIDAAPSLTEVYELYYRQKLFHDRFEFKIGRMDANNIFDAQPLTGSFLIPSTTNAATDYLLPTFPIPVPGVVLYLRPRRSTTLMLGAFYTDRFHPSAVDQLLNTLEPVNQPVGTFLISELDQKYSFGHGINGLLGLGAFYHVGRVQRVDNGTQSGFGSVYGFVDQTLWQPRPHQWLRGFVCLSAVDGRVSAIDFAANGGLLAQGMIPYRRMDQIGLAADWAHISYLAGLPKPYELGLEAFYALNLGHGITLQPDLQYWDNTGGGVYPNALVATMRLVLNF